jgi:hypothetical protein
MKHFEIDQALHSTSAYATKSQQHALSDEASTILSELIIRSSRKMVETIENFVPKYKMPTCFKGKRAPISLLPPTYNDFVNYDLNHWG